MRVNTPIGIGTYAAISVVLFSFIKEKALTTGFFIGVLLAFVTAILLYINILRSESYEESASKKDNHGHCFYFWVMTFVIGTSIGILDCWILDDLHSWNLCLAFVIWGGIYSLSHLASHETKVIENLLAKARVIRPRMFADWLRLEHETCQTAYQILISLLGLVVIGGIVGYYLSKEDFWSTGMQTTVVVTLWGIVGLWFGIIGPMSDKMALLRKKMRTLSSYRQANSLPSTRF